MKRILGKWNVYKCSFCKTNFAIDQLYDDNEETHCPKCGDSEEVTFINLDSVERV